MESGCTAAVESDDDAQDGLMEEEPQEDVRMHRLLLYLRPRYAEQEYHGQLEALDLVNCLIAPVFFANALSMWTRGLLSTVYCIVLLLKGYQMGLLLLPNARRVYAHQRARYWLILGERVLRQFVATPLLGRGPRFYQWLISQHATVPQGLFCTRMLLLLSGFTISFWNAFCLPLDFVSQVLVNGTYFIINVFGTLPQVAYVFQRLLRHSPRLILLQQGLERAFGTAVQVLQTVLLLLQRSSTPAVMAETSSSSSSSRGSCISEGAAAAAGSSGEAGVCINPAVAAADTAAGSSSMGLQIKPCPDITSVAGRFVLAATAAYLVFAVLLLPLYLAWRLERHLKSKWMASLPGASQQRQRQQQQRQQQQQQQNGASSAAAEASQNPGPSKGGSSSSSSSFIGATSSSNIAAAAAAAGGGGGGGGRLPATHQGSSSVDTCHGEEWFIFAPMAFNFIPDTAVLMKHVGIMAVVSLVTGQALVLACWLSPALLGMFNEQVIF